LPLGVLPGQADITGPNGPERLHARMMAEVHSRVLKAAIAAGDGDLDNSAVIQELRRRAAPRPVRPVARGRGPKAPEEQVQPRDCEKG